MRDLRETDIAAYTAEHGGGTFDALTRQPFEPAAGYAVGLARGSAAVIGLDGDLDETARRVAQEYEASLVGTWVHEGRIYVDPVGYFRDRDEATRIADANGQLAIYDFGTKQEVNIAYERDVYDRELMEWRERTAG